MSRGPGSIERAIEATFTSSPSSVFMTDDLVRVAYPGSNRAEKKHRVSILRAADKVGRLLWWSGNRCQKFGGQVVYYNLCDVLSYTLGRLRADFINNRYSLDELAQHLEDPAYKYFAYAQPGGAWYRHVEINCLLRDGRREEAEARRQALNGPLERHLKVLGSAIAARSN